MRRLTALLLSATGVLALAAAFGVGAAGGAAPAAGTAAVKQAGRVPVPALVPARGERCVEEPGYMRRHHMNLLKHQRDDTVFRGERQARHSLKGCIDCHASKETGSVAAAPGDFCQSCHAYAAVKLDCFECHSSRPGAPQASMGEPARKP